MFRNWFNRESVIKIETQILTLKPDDILVLSYDYHLTDEQLETVKKQIQSAFPTHRKILLFEGGGRLNVI